MPTAEEPAVAESRSDVETRHRKELKALEGEKRAALKKAKAQKGKKGKEAQANVEAEYADKDKQMKQRHANELAACQEEASNNADATAAGAQADAEASDSVAAATSDGNTGDNASDALSPDEAARQRKLEKARRKRENKKQKERQRQEEIAAETAAAGPTPRDIENDQLNRILQPLDLVIADVPADGNCLYRAVAAQLSSDAESAAADYQRVRALCAEALQGNADEFAPFCEYTDAVPDFATYVERVRTSDDWGGHLELRALATALSPRPIHVYSTSSGASSPMIIEGVVAAASSGASQSDAPRPIRLSYHLHYYSLGEHYNQVVPATSS